MRKFRYMLLIGALCATAISAQTQARGVGLVLDVQGQVVSLHGKKETALEITSVVEPNGQIKLDAGENIAFVFYPTRELYRVGGPSVLAIGAESVKTVSGAAPRVKKMSEEKTQVAQGYTGRMTPAALVMKGMPETIKLVSPRDGETVVDGEPEFSWQAAGPQRPLLFQLHDGSRLVFEQRVTGSAFKLPASLALQPQQRYRWVVSVDAPDVRIEGMAVFATATPEQQARVRRLLPAAAAEPEEWVLYAAALEEMGAATKAQHVWKRIAQTRPEARIVKELAE